MVIFITSVDDGRGESTSTLWVDTEGHNLVHSSGVNIRTLCLLYYKTCHQNSTINATQLLPSSEYLHLYFEEKEFSSCVFIMCLPLGKSAMVRKVKSCVKTWLLSVLEANSVCEVGDF